MGGCCSTSEGEGIKLVGYSAGAKSGNLEELGGPKRHILRVKAHVMVLSFDGGHGKELGKWLPWLKDPAFLYLYCVKETESSFVYQVTSSGLDGKEFFSFIEVPRTKLRKISSTFLFWKDELQEKVWGVNFSSERDILRFLAGCTPVSTDVRTNYGTVSSTAALSLPLAPPPLTDHTPLALTRDSPDEHRRNGAVPISDAPHRAAIEGVLVGEGRDSSTHEQVTRRTTFQTASAGMTPTAWTSPSQLTKVYRGPHLPQATPHEGAYPASLKQRLTSPETTYFGPSLSQSISPTKSARYSQSETDTSLSETTYFGPLEVQTPAANASYVGSPTTSAERTYIVPTSPQTSPDRGSSCSPVYSSDFGEGVSLASPSHLSPASKQAISDLTDLSSPRPSSAGEGRRTSDPTLATMDPRERHFELDVGQVQVEVGHFDHALEGISLTSVETEEDNMVTNIDDLSPEDEQAPGLTLNGAGMELLSPLDVNPSFLSGFTLHDIQEMNEEEEEREARRKSAVSFSNAVSSSVQMEQLSPASPRSLSSPTPPQLPITPAPGELLSLREDGSQPASPRYAAFFDTYSGDVVSPQRQFDAILKELSRSISLDRIVSDSTPSLQSTSGDPQSPAGSLSHSRSLTFVSPRSPTRPYPPPSDAGTADAHRKVYPLVAPGPPYLAPGDTTGTSLPGVTSSTSTTPTVPTDRYHPDSSNISSKTHSSFSVNTSGPSTCPASQHVSTPLPPAPPLSSQLVTRGEDSSSGRDGLTSLPGNRMRGKSLPPDDDNLKESTVDDRDLSEGLVSPGQSNLWDRRSSDPASPLKVSSSLDYLSEFQEYMENFYRELDADLTEPSVDQANSSGQSLPSAGLVVVKLPNDQVVVIHIDDATTVEDVLMEACELYHYVPEEHFAVFIEEEGKGQRTLVPQEHEKVFYLDFMRMEVWEKEIVTVSLHRPPAYVQEEAFGLTLLPVYADEEGDVLLSANVKSIATGSTAQLQGVTVGDEVIMVNDVALFEINWSGLQGLMTGPTVTLTVRTKKAALKQLKSRRGSIYRARRQSQDFLKDMNQDVLKAFLEPKGDEPVEEEEGTSSTSLSPQKMKAVVKVEKTIADLIQSERSNLKHLDSIMQIYYQPLQRAGVGHDEVNAIFGGIVSTMDFQRTLLADFEEVQESVHGPEYAQQPLKKAEHLCLGVTAAFNRHGERFKTFSMFCTCHCRLQNIISTDSGVLRQVLASCVPANQLSLKLETMFTKPIQRVLQYPLYLHVLEKQVPQDSLARKNLDGLISRMDVVVNYINEMQRISDNFTLLFDSLLRDVGQWKLSQSVSVQCLRFRGVFQWLNPNDEVPNKGWKKGQGPDIECFVFRALVLLFIIEKKKKRTSRASLNSVSSSSNGVSLDDVKFRTVLLCSTCVARDLPDSDGVSNMWQLFSALIGSNKVCTFILRCRSKEQKSQVLSIFK
nr:T-lymphoma invasion and metastasis-inducing protein 1B [Halisarca dujardinii]